MKCVILAAGEGVRMRPLTLKRPKPLLLVGGKTIIEHIIDSLPKEINELIIVVGYKGEQIQALLGEEFRGLKVRYVWQDGKLGTGHALRLCQPFLGREKFLMLFADDVYGRGVFEEMMKRDLSIAITEVEDPRKFGVILMNKDKKILEIEEKPENPKSNIVSCGAMILDERIFDYKPSRHSNGEYYLTTMINQLIQDHDLFGISASLWIPIGYPEDIKKAEKILKLEN
ncbi:MAG: nucleotidyltransferase family protein [Candidatus Niyogibacteria bacterium]|nr:nucleotidyltransferase family protein [Candidatus Niyogibacteria bacterium]